MKTTNLVLQAKNVILNLVLKRLASGKTKIEMNVKDIMPEIIFVLFSC